jgi:hypothetical protein
MSNVVGCPSRTWIASTPILDSGRGGWLKKKWKAVSSPPTLEATHEAYFQYLEMRGALRGGFAYAPFPPYMLSVNVEEVSDGREPPLLTHLRLIGIWIREGWTLYSHRLVHKIISFPAGRECLIHICVIHVRYGMCWR